MNANGVYIKLDEEHRKFISAETVFDQFMTAPPEVFATNPNSSISSFRKLLDKTTRIELPFSEKVSLTDLLAEFSDVFSDLPHPDGIDCEPMRIPFADESRIRLANKEFDDLLKKNFAVPNETKWSSPICLVTYADKAPRLTSDVSGKNGINNLSLTLDADLPKIADILPVLSKARYVATLDLPKAFSTKKTKQKHMDLRDRILFSGNLEGNLKQYPPEFTRLQHHHFDFN
ncbi:hypothetical protein GEMRC1_000667 [Eukaryota sp. GEM-RC1]